MTFFFFFFFFFKFAAARGAAIGVGGGSKRRPEGRGAIGSPGSAADAPNMITRPGLRAASDPRALSAELLVLLALAIAFRHPITEAIGTAGGDVPAARMNDTAVASHPETYVDLPRVTSYEPAWQDEAAYASGAQVTARSTAVSARVPLALRNPSGTHRAATGHVTTGLNTHFQ